MSTEEYRRPRDLPMDLRHLKNRKKRLVNIKYISLLDENGK